MLPNEVVSEAVVVATGSVVVATVVWSVVVAAIVRQQHNVKRYTNIANDHQNLSFE